MYSGRKDIGLIMQGLGRLYLKYIVLLWLLVLSCDRPESTLESKQIKVLYDTDMGNDTDDILGLIMLHNYMDLGMVELGGQVQARTIPIPRGLLICSIPGCGQHPVGTDQGQVSGNRTHGSQ